MRRVQVTVFENAAAFRQGLEAALMAAGFAVAQPDHVSVWARLGRDRVAVVTLDGSDACDLIDDVSAHNGIAVAMLHDPSPDEFNHALEHGAVSAVDWNAEPDDIVAVVAAASKGLSLLPAAVVAALAARGVSAQHAPPISAPEMEWLLALSNGTTVVDLASDAGYSERSMFRKLHDLYERLGVQNRVSAVREAERLGLLGVR